MSSLKTAKGECRRGRLMGYEWMLFKEDDDDIWTDDTVLTY